MRSRILVLMFLSLLSVLFGPMPARAQDANAVVTIEFVTDLSGSMQTNKLVVPTQTFLKEFVKELYPGDRVMLSTFGDSAVVGRPSNISTTNRDIDVAELVSEIDGYAFSQNYTYTSGALAAACPALRKQAGPKVLVLLTDGKEEIPSGSPPLWDDLPKLCTGIAIHVVALTEASKPTVRQVGDRLKATVHDATKQTLAEIGNEIRKGIRVFVTAEQTEFELGNLQVGAAGEIRTAFTVKGASNQLELTPTGLFPDGVEFSCASFVAPGDMRCSVSISESLKTGDYTGKITFEPKSKNLAVVLPTLEVKFSRGLMKITVSDNSLSLGALRPGQPTSVWLSFTTNGTIMNPKQISLNLTGFPEGSVQIEPTTISVPAEDVEFKVTLLSGNPGSYSGQISFQNPDPTMVVDPTVITVSFDRRTWYWENWKWTVPLTVTTLILLLGFWYFGIIVPRRNYRNRPLLGGRLEMPDGSELALDKTTDHQAINDWKFTASGTKQKLTVFLIVGDAEDLTVDRNGEQYELTPGTRFKLRHGDIIVGADNKPRFKFLNLNLNRK